VRSLIKFSYFPPVYEIPRYNCIPVIQESLDTSRLTCNVLCLSYLYELGSHLQNCPGLTRESELQICASPNEKDSEYTSAILVLIESAYCRLWVKLWHWSLCRLLRKVMCIFNQYECEELPRRCGLNAVHRLFYYSPYLPLQSIQPILSSGSTDMLVMFQAPFVMFECRVG
jgi:hypothetical protein